MTEPKREDWTDLSPDERPYHRVSIPDDDETPYEDWTVNERRAYLLDKIVNGHKLPSDIARVDNAEKFGVSHPAIHTDIEILKRYMSNYQTADFESEAYTVFRQALDELREDDPYKAVQVMEKWSEWLENRGEIEDESEETVSLKSSDDMEINFTVVESDDGDDEE